MTFRGDFVIMVTIMCTIIINRTDYIYDNYKSLSNIYCDCKLTDVRGVTY